jgi:hypothetical protein
MLMLKNIWNKIYESIFMNGGRQEADMNDELKTLDAELD